MNEKKDFYREYLKTSAVGLEAGLNIVVGAGLGYLAERYFHISPWGILVGTGLGIGAAIKTLYQFSKQYLKKNKTEEVE